MSDPVVLGRWYGHCSACVEEVVGLTRLWRGHTLTDRGRIRDEGDDGSDGDAGGDSAVDEDGGEDRRGQQQLDQY